MSVGSASGSIPELYFNGDDRHCYLPHAVEGFFVNGGKRVYVARVLDTALATRAAFLLFNQGTPPFGSTVLLRDVRENTGTAVNPPFPVVLSGTNLKQNDWIRIGDGSDAEYRQIIAPLASEEVLIPLNFPISRSHVAAGPINVEQFSHTPAGGALTLVGNVQRGDRIIEVTGAAADISALHVDSLVEVGANANVAEHRFVRQVTSLSSTNTRLILDSPLMRPYANGTTVQLLTLPGVFPATAQLAPSARAGESLLFVNRRGPTGTDFDTRTALVVIDRTNTTEDKGAKCAGLASCI